MGRIITIVCIVFLVIGCFWWGRNYHPSATYDGSVRHETATETGTSMVNGRNLGEVHPTPSRSDTPGTINDDPYNPNLDDSTPRTKLTQNDPYSPGGPYAERPGHEREPGDAQRRPEYFQPTRAEHRPDGSAYAQPVDDSKAPENPDGARFGGSGRYQWYRQGDLTYRLDTRTGQSCIIYATLEEWRKPFVYRHGCRTR